MAQQSPSAAVFLPGGTQLSSATSPLPLLIWAPHPRESLAAARAPPVLRTLAQWRVRPCCSSPSSPSRSPSPSLAMGSAASTDRAERRRRDRAPGHSGAPDPLVARPQDSSASEADVRRKGCKVAPEPKDGEEPAASSSLPGSPSFRIYCQKAAQVDALVAAAADEHADSDHGDGFARATDTTLAVRKNDPPHCSGELPKSKEGWLKFRGQTVVDALYSLFVCHSKRTSAPPPRHPPAAKPPRPGAASPAAAAAEPYL